jgi:hypothetical protein
MFQRLAGGVIFYKSKSPKNSRNVWVCLTRSRLSSFGVHVNLMQFLCLNRLAAAWLYKRKSIESFIFHRKMRSQANANQFAFFHRAEMTMDYDSPVQANRQYQPGFLKPTDTIAMTRSCVTVRIGCTNCSTNRIKGTPMVTWKHVLAPALGLLEGVQ